MSPTQVIIIALGILLAVSAAGNAWQYHEHDKAIEAVATAKQLNADTTKAAKACGDSVDKLATDTRARGTRLEAALAGQKGKIESLETQAIAALSAKPANPADLCGSAVLFLKGEIAKERAGGAR